MYMTAYCIAFAQHPADTHTHTHWGLSLVHVKTLFLLLPYVIFSIRADSSGVLNKENYAEAATGRTLSHSHTHTLISSYLFINRMKCSFPAGSILM